MACFFCFLLSFLMWSLLLSAARNVKLRGRLLVKAEINSLLPKTVDPRKLNFKSRLPLKGQINCVVRCLSTGLKYFLLRVKCLVQLNSLKRLTTTTSSTLISCKHLKYCLGYVCLSSNHIISYFSLM